MTQENLEFTDEMLTAYLDGELDARTHAKIDAALESDDALASRLATLDFPIQTLRAVMSPEVLAAPSVPQNLLTDPASSPAEVSRKRPRSFMPLALVASFLVGMVATTLIQPLPEPEAKAAPLGWVAAVASYQSLYVTETLSGPAQDAGTAQRVFDGAAETFDVALAPVTEVEGVEFKRAQMLGFRGKPLLQMAYLTPEGTPMALCLIKTDKPDRGKKQVEMFDLAGVSWVKDGVGYFLIGGDDAGQIDTLSDRMIAAL